MRVIGIDVGATKILVAEVEPDTGAIGPRRRIDTRPERGAGPVLDDCVRLARELGADRVGVGLCELVDRDRRVAAGDTVDWRGVDLPAAFGMPCMLESDVRAAAIAEARLGAGRGLDSFLYVTVSSGISHCFVIDGRPWPGHRGNAIVSGSPPIEWLASGRALAARGGRPRAEDVLGDPASSALVASAGAALGQVIAALINALDPEAVIVGGGLGLNAGYRRVWEPMARAGIYAPATSRLPILAAGLGADAGVVGAAIVAG